MSFQSVNPATQQPIETIPADDAGQVEAALAAASARFAAWRLESFETRAALMRRAAAVLEEGREDYARTMTLEMGKPIGQARAEIDKCALVCRHYADHAGGYLADEVTPTGAARSFVRHLPIGPVLAVMPWNFPFWQVFRFAAPTLMAGNVALLKHASNVPRSALNIADIFRRAGFPDGCFQTLMVSASAVAGIVGDDRVRAVTLTGSGAAGSAVGAQAGKAIKPSVLELGGTDAFIIMPSADLELAVRTAVKARTQNNGQSCIAAKRFLVHADIYEDFTARFVAAFDALKLGDPLETATDIGPLATQSGREEVDRQVFETLASGAKCLTRQRDLPERGWFTAPHVITGIPDNAPMAREEVFGPVAGLWKVASLSDAIQRANNSPFGLGSAIFTREQAEIETAVRDLEAGSTFVNAMVSSDPRLPFGGVKQSGYGRELAADGIRAFVNRKTVSIA